MRLVLATLMLLSFSEAFARMTIPVAKVVYGNDDRKEVFEASLKAQGWARSTATKFFLPTLQEANPNRLTINGMTLGESANMCLDQRFLNQPISADCSGFLVGPDLLATAAHCVDDQIDCDKTVWIFDYQVERVSGQVNRNPRPQDVYACKQVIRKYENEVTDVEYALVQLERNVTGREPLKIRTEGKISSNALVTLIGSPTGLPLKVVSGGQILDNKEDGYFSVNTDSFKGNSGSPLINEQTGLVEGLMVRGQTDYDFDDKQMCDRVMRCPEGGCDRRGKKESEDAIRITEIVELGQQQNVLKAAYEGDLEVIFQYLDKKAWIDTYDHMRQSMVFKAIQGQQLDTLDTLIQHKADLNLRDLNGETPLHAAVKIKNLTLVKKLLDAGANPRIRNNQGKTAADLCQWHSVKQRRIRQFLQQYSQNNR